MSGTRPDCPGRDGQGHPLIRGVPCPDALRVTKPTGQIIIGDLVPIVGFSFGGLTGRSSYAFALRVQNALALQLPDISNVEILSLSQPSFQQFLVILTDQKSPETRSMTHIPPRTEGVLLSNWAEIIASSLRTILCEKTPCTSVPLSKSTTIEPADWPLVVVQVRVDGSAANSVAKTNTPTTATEYVLIARASIKTLGGSHESLHKGNPLSRKPEHSRRSKGWRQGEAGTVSKAIRKGALDDDVNVPVVSIGRPCQRREPPA